MISMLLHYRIWRLRCLALVRILCQCLRMDNLLQQYQGILPTETYVYLIIHVQESTRAGCKRLRPQATQATICTKPQLASTAPAPSNQTPPLVAFRQHRLPKPYIPPTLPLAATVVAGGLSGEPFSRRCLAQLRRKWLRMADLRMTMVRRVGPQGRRGRN